MSVAVIVGSAYGLEQANDAPLEIVTVDTPLGPHTLYRRTDLSRDAWVAFRHERPHRLLPHQIPYRRQAAALKAVGCGALLVTSSVGVMDPEVPILTPLWVQDLLMPDNRLPDGTACTMFTEPSTTHGHLVLEDGLFSTALTRQLQHLCDGASHPMAAGVIFAYVGGPRTKTAAENAWWAACGAQVNSMTLAPEVVLANELEIPTAALVVGHKYSVPGVKTPAESGIARSLKDARTAMDACIDAFLVAATAVPFANHLFRFPS